MANQYRSVLASSGPAPTGGDAVAANVLAGKTFTNDNGAQTGTMTNNGAVSGSATPAQPYTIPEGYHNGSGIVTASGTEVIESGHMLMAQNNSISDVTLVSGQAVSMGAAKLGTTMLVNVSGLSGSFSCSSAIQIYHIANGQGSSATSAATYDFSNDDYLYLTFYIDGSSVAQNITFTFT